MSGQHTPGPWSLYEKGNYFYVKGSGEGHTYVLQRKKYLGKGEDVRIPADCRLIAAAPDLLAACRLFAAYQAAIDDPASRPLEAYGTAMDAALAAIAKATGSAT